MQDQQALARSFYKLIISVMAQHAWSETVDSSTLPTLLTVAEHRGSEDPKPIRQNTLGRDIDE